MIKLKLLALISLLLVWSALLRAQTVTTFEGIDASQLARPQLDIDPNGAVGTKQFMEWVNVYYQAYDKLTFAPVWPTPQSGVTPFKAAMQSNCTNVSGDGVIIFDRLASRWVIGVRASAAGQYYYCVAVSNTDDLTAGGLSWFTYVFPLSSILGGNEFPDWPRLATWSDGYYLTIDLNNLSENFREDGVVACALDRANMIIGGTANPPQCFTIPNPVPGSVYLAHSLIPADVDGTIPPPVGRDEYMVSIQNPPNDGITTTSNTFNLWTFHVDWSNPSNSSFTQTPISVAPYTPGCYVAAAPAQTVCVPELSSPTTGQRIDSVGDRFMPRLDYRNFGSYESFLFSHAIQPSSASKQTAIRWYELRGPGTPSVYQNGNISPDQTLYRFMPSIAQDLAGNAAVGYSVSNNSSHPGIAAAWWSLNPMTSPIEAQLFSGSGDEENSFHWGDYTSMTVDPVDGCTFWYVNEYFAQNQTGSQINWNTRVSNFKLPGCGQPSLAPNSLNFGSQTVGTTSAAQTVTLYNSQTVALNGINVSITGANAGDFAETDTCGASLPAGETCTLSVTFTPTANGSRTATLTVADDAANSPQITGLTGTGVSQGPVIVLTPSSINFGNQLVGTSSAASPVMVSNTGTGPAMISNIGIGGTNPGDFGQLNNCPSTLPAGQSCTINVTFLPTTTGTRNAILQVTDNAPGSPQTTSLTGNGITLMLSVSPVSLSFGKVNVGTTSAAKTVTVSNTGTATVSISGITITGANSGDYAQKTTCGSSLASGASCKINVTFTPLASGSRTATLTITDTATNSPQTVSLTGVGVQPNVNLNPHSLAFGTVQVGVTSPAKTVTLTNNGGGTLTITSIMLTGNNPGDFAQSNDCGSTVISGGSCTISVTFTPTAIGARTANVSITDNASGSPQQIGLSGTGH